MSAWAGAARRLAPGDIEAAADALGVPRAALVAVLAVEARGTGFDAAGRVIILYEPHVYYRQLKVLGPGKLMYAEALGLAYPRRGTKPYPIGQDAQYQRLDQAVQINREAALRACSFGLGQVLGENYAVAGFESAVAMAAAAKQSEADQLAMMLRFIRTKGLVPAMQRQDWLAFERGYNGTGAGGKYAVKLAAAFKQASGKALAWVPPATPPRRPIPVHVISDADRLNDAELARLRQVTADELNARELARIRGTP